MGGVSSGELWLAVLSGSFLMASSIIGVMYTLHRQNQEREERRIAAQEKRNIQFDVVSSEYPMHRHGDVGDDDMALTKGNIRYVKHSA
jgi:hypothetical protein